MFTINWTQHAVGHGGFHVGQAKTNSDTIFTWIFDCGAQRANRLNDYLKAWIGTHITIVDWLFISHFDKDHVSGLDTLMSRAMVRDVMIPYVNERELAFILLYEIGRDNLDRSFFELVADPATFFLSRGADRVTFLGGPARDTPTGDVRPRGGSPEDQADRRRVKILPTPQPLDGPYWSKTSGDGDASVQQIPDVSSCDIHTQHGLRLKPYRAPIQAALFQNLITQLQTLVGSHNLVKGRPGLGALAYGIAKHARTSKGRSDLRDIFKKHVGSSNRSSLSLLTAPIKLASNPSGRPHELVHEYGITYPYTHVWGRGTPAWLNTGDAELLTPTDLADWQNCYNADLLDVRVLSLPHHGSDKNSDGNFQASCPSAVLTAHVKSNSAKHPGGIVRGAAGNKLVCVTEQLGSEVSMWFQQR